MSKVARQNPNSSHDTMGGERTKRGALLHGVPYGVPNGVP